MKLIKPVLWTVCGVVIGASTVLTADRVQAQQQAAERIQVSPAWQMQSASNAFGLYIVKDGKSGGCWLAAKDRGNWAALAVAPASACDETK